MNLFRVSWNADRLRLGARAAILAILVGAIASATSAPRRAGAQTCPSDFLPTDALPIDFPTPGVQGQIVPGQNTCYFRADGVDCVRAQFVSYTLDRSATLQFRYLPSPESAILPDSLIPAEALADDALAFLNSGGTERLFPIVGFPIPGFEQYQTLVEGPGGTRVQAGLDQATPPPSLRFLQGGLTHVPVLQFGARGHHAADYFDADTSPACDYGSGVEPDRFRGRIIPPVEGVKVVHPLYGPEATQWLEPADLGDCDKVVAPPPASGATGEFWAVVSHLVGLGGDVLSGETCVPDSDYFVEFAGQYNVSYAGSRLSVDFNTPLARARYPVFLAYQLEIVAPEAEALRAILDETGTVQSVALLNGGVLDLGSSLFGSPEANRAGVFFGNFFVQESSLLFHPDGPATYLTRERGGAGIEIVGPDAEDFVLPNNPFERDPDLLFAKLLPGQSLAPDGERSALLVEFRPRSLGEKRATLVLHTNKPGRERIEVPLLARAVEPTETCPAEPEAIACGETVEGCLSEDDRDLFGDGTRVDAFLFTVAETANVTIRYERAEFSPFIAVADATLATLLFQQAGSEARVQFPPGTYNLVVNNAATTTYPAGYAVSVTCETPAGGAALSNLSTRGRVGDGDGDATGEPMIQGFIVEGAGKRRVLVSGVGPDLANYGLTSPLANPSLALLRGSELLASNDDWGSGPDAAAIAASGHAPARPEESALIAELPAGEYTAVLSGAGGAGGQGLVQVFDLGPGGADAGAGGEGNVSGIVPLGGSDGAATGAATGAARLANVSTRLFVGQGDDAMIAGLEIRDDGTGGRRRVVVRGLGPSLAAFGVEGVLADPELAILRGQELVAANGSWRDAPAAADIGSLGFAPGDDAEAALLLELEPGSYTAVLSGAGGGTGQGLIEIYELP